MGNILSYFFPQPAPASIEQVEEVVQEEKTKEEIIEETVADAVEDVAVVEDVKTADMVVDKEIEAEVNNDEGFEVVEEATLSEISNSQQNTLAEEEPEISEPKVESPGPAFTDDIQTKLESKTDVAQQPSKDEELKEDELKMVEVEMALTSNIRSADVEVIGSIQDENELDDQDLITEAEKKLEKLEQETPVAVVPEVPSPEPIKAATPEESDDEDNIEEPGRVCVPETTEEIKAEPTTSPEVEQHKEVSGGVAGLKDILTEPQEIPSVPARVATPEPPKVPELKMSAVAPEQEDTESLTSELVKDASPEVEIIGSINDEDLASPPTEPTKTEISENPKAVSPAAVLEDYEMKEDSPEAPVKDARPEVEQQKEVEVSGGVTGLKDILTETNKFDE